MKSYFISPPTLFFLLLSSFPNFFAFFIAFFPHNIFISTIKIKFKCHF